MDPNSQPTDPSTNTPGTEIKPSSSMPEMPAAEPMETPAMGVTPTVSDPMPAPAADPMPTPGPVEAPVTPAPMAMPAAVTPMAKKSNKKMMMIVVVVVIVVAVAAYFIFMKK